MIPAWPLNRAPYSGSQQFKILLWALLIGIGNSTIGLVNTHILGLPLFMDTIGTLISTAAFGFWPGMVTAFTTHGWAELLRGITGETFSFPWVICSFTSVITLDILIRLDLFKTFFHAIIATILITLANSISGAFVAVIFFSGITLHPVDYIATAFLSIGESLLSSAFWARIPINMIDKGIAVFITFGLSHYLRIQRGKEKAF
jgi:energy-coupling factor transport system substrate-specific component